MEAKDESRFTEAINAFADAKNALDEARDVMELAQKKADYAESRLFDLLENAGLRQVRSERGLFSMNDLAWAQVTDGEAARAWAEANMPEIITLNRSRLSVVVRTALKEGEALPPGVDFTTSRKVSWRRQ